MKELTIDEIKQVKGGFGPAVYGAIVLAGRIAANPTFRTAVKGFYQGFAGGAGGWTLSKMVDKKKNS